MPDQVVVTDISDVSKAYSVLGGFIVIYGLVSYVAKDRLYLSEPLIAVIFGIITGPYVLGWVDPLSWGTTEETNYVTYEISRLVIGVQVLFTGISLPKAYLRKEALSLTVLLLIIMTIAWFISALLIWGLIPNLTFLESLAISAAITPTDPVLASSISKGRFAEKHVPANIRNIILAESGANDGLGFPFLFLAVYLIARTGEDRGTTVGTEIGRWVYGVVLYRIVLSCVYGTIIGVLAHTTLKWAETRGYIDRDNFFAYGFGLALFTLGTTGLFNSDDILACFVAGNAFTWWDWYRVRTQVEEEDSFQDIIDSLLNAAIFIYIGAIIPWSDYNTGNSSLMIDPWRIVVLGICVLVIRRLPWVVVLMKAIPAITTFQESIFAGWFGPIGVGAVFYIQVALREIPDDGTRDRLRAVYTPIVLFIVFSSVLTHGMTIPLARIGPKIIERTTSLSQTRTISVTQRPSSRSQSPSNTSNDHHGPTLKEIWNPFFALWHAILHITLFWQKDSFWRRENAHQRNKRILQGNQISKPMNAVKMASINEAIENDREQKENNDGENQPSTPFTEENSNDTAAITKPQAIADIHDKQNNLLANAGKESFISSIKMALEREVDRERKEAFDENAIAAAKRLASIKSQQNQKQQSKSLPGTPGGSRVRFHQ